MTKTTTTTTTMMMMVMVIIVIIIIIIIHYFWNWNLKSEFFEMTNPENCLVDYYTEQSPANFPIIEEPPPISRRQWGKMKQVSYWGHSSAVTCELHRYLVLAARCMWTDTHGLNGIHPVVLWHVNISIHITAKHDIFLILSLNATCFGP
jgi:nitrogen fixation-related uncharacterized protein